MKKAQFAFLAVLVAALVAGCPGMKKAVTEAKATANLFYQSRQAGGDMEKTLGFYSPKFFAAVGRDKWQSDLERIKANLGDVKVWDYQTSFNYVNKVGTDEPLPGKQVALKLDVDYTNGAAVEELTWYLPADGSGGWQIVKHTIEPKQGPTGGSSTPAPGGGDENGDDEE